MPVLGSWKTRRLLLALGLGTAFIGMASVFTPDRSGAGELVAFPRDAPRVADAGASVQASGVRSLGEFVGRAYTVEVFATAAGPRYTIIDNSTEDELASMLTAQEAAERFPQLQLPQVDFSATGQGPHQLMLADPEAEYLP